MLDEAVWRTLFDGVNSEGLNDPAARLVVEENVIGIPQNAEPADRPAYGYLEGSDESGVATYGDVILHLDRDTRSRVTFCLGDSLRASNYGEYPVLAASPLEDPQLRTRHGETDILPASTLSDACDPRDRMAEAHVHGKVAPGDVNWATFTTRPPDVALVQALLDNDIEWIEADA
jgi:hypothetical protein